MSIIKAVTALFAATFVIFSTPAAAQEELPEAVSAILEKAALRDASQETVTFLDTAVVLSIDAFPALRAAILEKAGELVPGRREAFIALADQARPQIDSVEPAPVIIATEAPAAPPPAEAPAEPVAPSGFFSLSGWEGQFELGGALNSGNTEEQSVTAGLKLANERKKWRHEVNALLDFTRTDGTTSKQDLEASYQLNYKFSDRLYAFTLLSYEDKRFSGFDYRTAETIGIGYKVLEGETYFMNIEGGPTARQSKIAITGMTENELGVRLNTLFHWDISDTLSLENTAGAIIGEDSTTLEETLALTSKLTESLSGRLSFNILHNTNVPLGAKKTDTVTRAAVVYAF